MTRYKTESLFPTQQTEQTPCNYIIRLAFDSAVDNVYDYAVPDELWPIQQGQRIEAPFGRANKPQIGFCVSADVPQQQSFIARPGKRKLKIITKIIDPKPLLDPQLMELANWISSYYICPLGQVLTAMVPAAVKKGAGIKKQKCIYLSGQAAENLRSQKQKQIIEYLRHKNATDSESALETRHILETIGCTNAPIKSLAQKQIIKTVLRTILKSPPAIPKSMVMANEKVTLNHDQQNALDHFKNKIDSEKFGVTLLHGVTDSGKTELYIRAIETVLAKKRTAIILLPEIALTAQTVQRFSSRFEKIAVLHSRLTAPQRNAQWQKIKSGDADVVIGARSAIFAPIPRLGLIVIDEEHEPGYKQDTVPRYHGRDTAIKRAQLANAHCILGTATPSLETLFNCKYKKHYDLVRLPKRVMNLPMPEMKLIDMRDYPGTRSGAELICEPLTKRLEQTLARGEQAILLLNRRGYSNFVFCPSCKHTLHCRNCDVTLTFHKSQKHTSANMRTVTGKHLNFGHAICHYCLAQTLVPQKCPLCGKSMAMIGLGSQKLEEELNTKFPDIRAERIDSDSMAGKNYYTILRQFSEGKINVLAGTQMIAKGLHFPNVTLVGIISADTSLLLPDFRANERTFQLISQVAGRTGRSEKKGIVFVQTFLPDQPAIKFALQNDFAGFVQEELKHRKACNLPPYWRLAAVVLRDQKFDKLEAASALFRQRIDDTIQRHQLKLTVRGPIPAVISRIQTYHRMQIIIQAPTAETIRRLFTELRKMPPIASSTKIAIDIDPTNLL